MVAKNQIKFIKSLQQKKYRGLHGLFLAEGIKTVRELLDSTLEVYGIYSTDLSVLEGLDHLKYLISKTELKQISALKSPNTMLGVFHIPKPRPVDYQDWVLALDDVGDPGNLGTIIRLCDWFGIKHLICSKNTVDCYNPKVLQATMGSIARINITYTDLPKFLAESGQQIYGTFMDGKSLYGTKLSKTGILVMGNEAHGISGEIEKLCQKRVAIPQFGGHTTESLNVAMASAIFLSGIRRQE